MLEVNTGYESINKINFYVDDQLATYKVPIKIGYKLRIVIDEIYSNIVNYSDSSKTGLDIYVEDGKFYLIFTDNGIPYNPLNAQDPDINAPAEERESGGLGVYIVRQLMDEVAYTYEDGKNKLCLMIQL